VSEQAVPVGFDEDQFEAIAQRSLWLDALERLVRNKAAVLGLIIAIIVLFTAAFGTFVAPHDYLRTNITNKAAAPSWEYPMGTDLIGRDLLSRMMAGARTAVFVAFVSLSIGTFIGIAIGAVAAYAGGNVDDVLMRITDVTFGFPDLLLVVFLSTTLRQPVVEYIGQLYARTQWGILKETIFLDYLMVFGALALVNWAGTARLIRGQVLSLREQDFIRAVYALGIPSRQIITRHLVPNSMAPIMVGLSVGVGGAMLSESSLSFLGMGIQPPGASWGNMISENLLTWRQYPHLVAMPGLVLAIAVFGFNFLGDGINDAMNPKQIRR
jgi:peptide/nickel transport system permease protein